MEKYIDPLDEVTEIHLIFQINAKLVLIFYLPYFSILRDQKVSGREVITRADLSGAKLSGAKLSGATLSGANIGDALSLEGTDLRRVKGLTKEQLEACKAKGAIIDEDPTTNASQATVAPPPPS